METSELREIAEQTRTMRDIGTALVFASLLLAVFLFIPHQPEVSPSQAVAVATSTAPDAFAKTALAAEAAIVYDLVTGETLYAKNVDAQLPLASLTKLLTVYAAVMQLEPRTPITISTGATQLSAPRAFSPGQTFALDDLARLTLTASLNDGAAAIIEATAVQGNRTQTAALAGAAAALSLSQTYAVNGSGLDVSTAVSGGYGSARDLARLSGALVAQAPDIALATTKDSVQAVSDKGKIFTVKNTDPIVDTIPHLLLSKTGYTDLAGGNLALVFDVGLGHPIAIIVLGSSKHERFTDGTALVKATLAHFAGVSVL